MVGRMRQAITEAVARRQRARLEARAKCRCGHVSSSHGHGGCVAGYRGVQCACVGFVVLKT